MRVILVMLMALMASVVAAHGDEDHGDAPHPVAAQADAPRFEARSDVFEVVGVLKGSELLIYVDRADNNAPLMQAEVEIESGRFKATAKADASGVLRMPAGALATPGKYPLTLTVSAGDQNDLLSTTFEHVAPTATSQLATAGSTLRLGSAAGLAVLMLLGAGLAWRHIKRRAA